MRGYSLDVIGRSASPDEVEYLHGVLLKAVHYRAHNSDPESGQFNPPLSYIFFGFVWHGGACVRRAVFLGLLVHSGMFNSYTRPKKCIMVVWILICAFSVYSEQVSPDMIREIRLLSMR